MRLPLPLEGSDWLCEAAAQRHTMHQDRASPLTPLTLQPTSTTKRTRHKRLLLYVNWKPAYTVYCLPSYLPPCLPRCEPCTACRGSYLVAPLPCRPAPRNRLLHRALLRLVSLKKSRRSLRSCKSKARVRLARREQATKKHQQQHRLRDQTCACKSTNRPIRHRRHHRRRGLKSISRRILLRQMGRKSGLRMAKRFSGERSFILI